MTSLTVSKLVDEPVLAASGSELGKIVDCVVRLVDGSLPAVTGLVARVDGHDFFIPAQALAGLSPHGARLNADSVDRQPFQRRPGEVLLDQDVLGRSVIDVDAARLVRVKDVVLEEEQGLWRVASVVPSPPSRLLAALGMGRANEAEIQWGHIEPLTGHVPTARLKPSVRLAKLRPADIADIVEEASHDEGEEILDAVHHDHELEADVFEELDEEHRIEFIEDRSDAEVAEVLANMDPDDAADLLMQLDQERRRPVLDLLPAEQQRRVRTLLGFNPETAGGLMSNEFLAIPEGLSVGESLEVVRRLEEPPDVLTDVYGLDSEQRLVGTITLADLLRAEPASQLGSVIDRDPVAVYADADLPAVAVEMADYNLAALPVVDEDCRILGVITYDDLIEAMIPEEWRWRGRAEQPRFQKHEQPEESAADASRQTP